MERNDEKLIELVNSYSEEHNDYVTTGNIDNQLVIMVDSWETAERIEAALVAIDVGPYDVVFNDEYLQCAGCCNGCNNLVRVVPSSWFWTEPYFDKQEMLPVCDDCLHNYDDVVLEEYKNQIVGFPHCFKPNNFGLTKVNKAAYQNGWHDGMNDRPEPILKALNAQGIDVWFIVHPSQFYVEFDVYVKLEDADKASNILKDLYVGPDRD